MNQYKVLLIVHKALNSKAPLYIQDMITVKHDPNHDTRSNGQNLLVIPRRRTKYGATDVIG